MEEKVNEIFKSLSEITFLEDDSQNPLTWAHVDLINTFMNQAIGDLAYYISPINFGFQSNESILNTAKNICRRQREANQQPFNEFYKSSELTKPFIFIANTATVLLAESDMDYNKEGGSHWVSWILLPKKYRTLSGKEVNKDKYTFVFFDSTATHKIPQALEQHLTQDTQYSEITDEDEIPIKLFSFCNKEEIDFIVCDKTGQQNDVNGSDCGFWAMYYVLMTFYTGSVDFLDPIANQPLSGMPLRRIMKLDDIPTDEQKDNIDTQSGSMTSPKIEPSAASMPGVDGLAFQPSLNSALSGEGDYAASGTKRALHGTIYQLKLLMLFLKRGLDKKYSFWLATEMDAAGKFDDVVFKYTESASGDDDIRWTYRFLQAKHKWNDEKRITDNDLLTEKDEDFSLQKYFITFRNIKKQFNDGNIKDFIICTNSDFDFAGDDKSKKKVLKLKTAFDEINTPDDILNIAGKNFPKIYKFKKLFSGKKEALYPILQETSDVKRLAKKLAELVLNEKQLALAEPLFKLYHGALAKEVFDIKSGKFLPNFTALKPKLTPVALKFRQIFLVQAKNILINARKLTVDCEEASLWKEINSKKISFPKKFGEIFEANSNPQLTDINEFVSEFYRLLENKIAEIGTVKIERRRELIKANIDKLAGHVLVLKNDKIQFSNAFLQGDKLSGNLNQFRDEMKKLLDKNKSEFKDLAPLMFDIADFNTCEEEQLNVKPALPNDVISNEDIEEFLEKLVFAVNQPNEVELGKIIKKELGEEFNLIDGDYIYTKFLNDMLDWMKAKQGRFLKEKHSRVFFEKVKQKIAKLVMIGPTLEYRAKIEKPGIKFKCSSMLDGFLFSNYKILHLISVEPIWLSSVKVYCELLAASNEYQKDDSYIFIRLETLISLQTKVVNAFTSSGSNLLVVECDKVISEETSQAIFDLIAAILNKNDKKKLILIASQNHTFTKLVTANKDGQFQSLDGYNYSDLTQKSQDLIKAILVNFQERKTCLAELIPETSLAKYLTTPAIIDLFSHDTESEIIIDRPIECLKSFERACYIERTFNHLKSINLDVLKSTSNDIFAIDGIQKELLQKDLPENANVRHISEDDAEKDINPIRFIILNSGTADKEFKQLKKDYRTHSIHRCSFKENKLIWHETYGSVAGLRYYLKKDDITEFRAVQVINKIIIVAAEPGMGKSTLLTHLAESYKTENSNLWIIKINLLECKAILAFHDFTCLANAIKFLANVQQLTVFGEQVLSYRLQEQGDIIVLMDGFDEIESVIQIKVIGLLKILKETAVTKLIVATRLHMQEELENNLGEFAFTLKPFLEEDKKSFIKSYWKENLRLETLTEEQNKRLESYIEVLIKHFSDSTVDKSFEFLGIPLQARMLAEAFQADFFEFYNSPREKPLISEKLDILALYQRFIDKKYNIYLNDKIKVDSHLSDGLKHTLVYSLTKIHQQLAFKALFPEKKIEFFLSKKRNYFTSKDINAVGLIQILDDKTVFIHRTFSEFFAAKFILSYFKKSAEHTKYQQVETFLLDHIFKLRNEVIKMFIEKKITEKNPKLFEKWKSLLNRSLIKPVKQEYYNIHIDENQNITKMVISSSVRLKWINDRLRAFSDNEHEYKKLVDLLKLISEDKSQVLNEQALSTLNKVFSNKTLSWLEKIGVHIAYIFHLLTPIMVRQFINVLSETNIGRSAKIYANNIWMDLLLPLINMMKDEPVVSIDKLSFIEIFTYFARFAMKYENNISLSYDQLQVVLKIIYDLLDGKYLSSKILKVCIKGLVTIVNATGFKLINTNTGLLILDVVSEFQYKFFPKNKALIIDLIECAQNPEQNFDEACIKAAGELLPSIDLVMNSNLLIFTPNVEVKAQTSELRGNLGTEIIKNKPW